MPWLSHDSSLPAVNFGDHAIDIEWLGGEVILRLRIRGCPARSGHDLDLDESR